MGHQEQGQTLRETWALQGFEVESVEIEESTDRGGRPAVKLVRLHDVRGVHVCPQCGKRHREGLFEESMERRWRDRSLGDFETYVVLTPLRIACCGGRAWSRCRGRCPGTA
ncbi:MAG: hypothetical protein IPK72_10635 [Candidatus Eisenbacteria bacterium]|nr:hypothetical protein [Candidatus Eisenbacteria bacterium]